MRQNRRLLVPLLSGALVLQGILLWRVTQGPQVAVPGDGSVVPALVATPGASSPDRIAPDSESSRPALSEADALEAIRRDPEWRWRRPIDFWGVVLDQQGHPVSGARVDLSWTDRSPAGNSSETRTTDPSGRVHLNGKTGAVLTVRASSDGFHNTRDSHRILNYAEPWDPQFHRPDPDRPVVLRLRRKGHTEPLVHRENLRFPITSTAGEVRLDLVGQRAVLSGGDLRISLQHGPEEFIEGRRRFDWEILIAAVDGGLASHSEEFPFRAPETGYLPVIRFSQSARDSVWQDGFEGRFFLRSRNGQVHARIQLRISPFPKGAPPTVTVLDYHLNPAGSRNLEYASELDVSSDHYDRARRGPQ